MHKVTTGSAGARGEIPERLEEARTVLDGNDRGDHTVPAGGLYPHQWNWDSAFAALGWATIDGRRAWRELERLLGAQHQSGFLPHIAFDPSAASYEPGPDAWGELSGLDGRRTTGITQPPVAATCARLLFERAPDEAAAQRVVERLAAWHDFLLGDRDPVGRSEPVVVHPWESGRDNALEWDDALLAAPAAERPIHRVDTGFVDAAQRPTDRHYRHYMGLVEAGHTRGWNQRELATSGSFRMLDPAFSSLLAGACSDLGWLANAIGAHEVAERSVRQASDVSAALARRAGSDGLVWSADLVADCEVCRLGCAQALVLLAPSIPQRMVDAATALVTAGAPLASPFGVRSASLLDPDHAPDNYWRGPVWANVTWLVALGAERHGRPDLAGHLRAGLRRFVESAGMREYVHGDSGAGCGARDFTWTAALWLWEQQPRA